MHSTMKPRSYTHYPLRGAGNTSREPRDLRFRDGGRCRIETQERRRVDNGEHVEVRGGHVEAGEHPLRGICPSSEEE